MSYIVLCDSCTDLTPQQVSDPHIVRIPLTITVGEQVFVDDGTVDQAQLLWAMRECPEAPKTACPSIDAYLRAFDCGAKDIYIVTLSALLSGSHNVAVQARAIYLEEHPDRNIHVFNSCSASAGQVNVLMQVEELAKAGLPFNQVVRQTERFISTMDTLFVLETLENLRKNGRLTRVQAALTSTLRIKLLMGATSEGEIRKVGQSLSVKQALSKLAFHIAEKGVHAGRRLVISHCNCLDRAFYLRGILEESCQFREIVICETGGISTVYANDGGIVVAY